MTKEEILKLIKLAKVMKKARKDNAVPKLLSGKTLAMIFELPSSRTRISFANAMTLLGGSSLFLKPGEIHLGKIEELKDTARVISSLSDGLLMRAWNHESVLELTSNSTVPVINGLTDYNHPSQALSDILTITEEVDKPLEEVKIVFVGDKTNVLESLVNIAVKLDISVVHIAPKRYQMKKAAVTNLLNNNKNYKGKITISDSLTHLKNADIIYTDLWWWIDQNDEIELRKEKFSGKYGVKTEMLDKTKNTSVKFMHCLPAVRELEVSNEVIDGDHSIVFSQAENKLYMAMAILTTLLYVPFNHQKSEEYKKMINKII